MKYIHAFIILFSGLAILSFSSCRKTITPDDQVTPKKMEDLKISPAFNWESTREINLTVAADLPNSIGSLSKITVYDANPVENGQVLLTGSAGYNFPFVTTLRIPTAVVQLFLEMKNGDGSVFLTVVAVTDNINYTFTGQTVTKSSGEINEPDCTSGCDVTVTGSSVTINKGKTFCITSPFNGSLNFEHWNGGGTVKICSTAVLSSINNMGTGCSIIITGTGVVNMNSSFSMDGNASITVYQSAHAHFTGGLNMNMASTSIINYSSDFTIGQSFSPNGPVFNYGKMSVKGDFNINGGSSLVNTGSFDVNGSFQANKNVTNTGSIEVKETVNLNSSSVIQNDCKWIIHGSLNVNPTSLNMNNGYIRVDETINLNSGLLNLSNQSLISAKNMVLNSDANGAGSKSSIKVNTATINGAKVKGPIEFATQNGTINNGNASKFINGATLVSWSGITNYIPKDECNPEGIGDKPGPSDTDGDGVPDNLDDYPTDPTRAYNNYYPAKGQFGSLAFEDLWPSRGDYDMNDMVVDFNYWYITNAQNKVVDVKPTFYVRAAGASLQNGFGFQFDGVLSSAVASVAGTHLTNGYINVASNGTENNQENAVVIVSDNIDNVIHRVGGTYYNTEKNAFYGISDTVKINLHFAVPQLQSAVGAPPYNPFLIKNMMRGVEVHLPDHSPTSLADQSLFGTGDDDSNPATGKYYKTKTNLPWGISVPQKFDYTWELIEIVYGHLKFGTWAESGGTSFPDWYKDLSGYRDATQIYLKPVK